MLLEAAQLLHDTQTNRFLVLCDFGKLPANTCFRFLFCGRGSVRLCYLAGPCLERLRLQGEWLGRPMPAMLWLLGLIVGGGSN